MRGKQIEAAPHGERDGITPAHAGKTQWYELRHHRRRDHPRACGENSPWLLFDKGIRGSPPRMRGKLCAVSSDCADFGITPAHAGKTPSRDFGPFLAGDHPRACGENTPLTREKPAQRGSPPRMRGKPGFVDEGAHRPGITPAHAGKTWPRRSASAARRDHPRACGENRSGCWRRFRRRGSPPRMRGKLLMGRLTRDPEGITPAHAGKTSARPGSGCSGRDHPRACGENGENIGKLRQGLGSPPRMRGKHFGKGVFPWLILVLSLDPL